MKKGLVMEGGAMRGLFTAGVTDVFMENGIKFDGGIGTSAGAAFGCNYKSGQIGRSLRYNKRFCNDKRYFSTLGFIKTGNLYSDDFCYHELPKVHDIFDFDEFNRNPMEFYIVCTDVETGMPVYHKYDKEQDDIDTILEWIRASCAMPLLEQIVNVGGYSLLDGGVGDSVPLEYFESIGYDKNVVILTQPISYVKKKLKYGAVAKLKYKNYPNLVEQMLNRHERYNAMYQRIREKEIKGEIVVIRPENPLDISVTRDKDKMQRVYDLGRQEGLKNLEKVKKYLGC